MQRLSEVEFPLATSPDAYSKCSTTCCTLLQVTVLQKRTLLDLATAREKQGALTPPTAQSPVPWLSGHDLVAISMGMGGWVFKKTPTGSGMNA